MKISRTKNKSKTMNSYFVRNISTIKTNYLLVSKLKFRLRPTRLVRHLCSNNDVGVVPNRTDSISSSSSSSSSYLAINLTNKGLLRVSGEGSFIYLQSLLSNDMRKLLPFEDGDATRYDAKLYNKPVIYSYLQSSVGRVLCDLFVYRSAMTHYNGEYILEVDKQLLSAVKRLLLGYNLSRNISVEIVKDIDLWSLIPMSLFSRKLEQHKMDDLYDIKPTILSCPLETIDSKDITLSPDPRIGSQYFGYRFITRLGGKSLHDIQAYINPQQRDQNIKFVEGKVSDYTRLKYKTGICEGHEDIQSGFYFPFELNGDFLNGICLDKGLYTAEERLIKAHSRGAIKRRIFPIEFLCSPNRIRQLNPAPRTNFDMSGVRNFGELRGRLGRIGIASLLVPMENGRFNLRNRTSSLPQFRHQDSGLMARAFIPEWWPYDYDQVYLDAPDYPNCLFDTNANKDDLESVQFLEASNLN